MPADAKVLFVGVNFVNHGGSLEYFNLWGPIENAIPVGMVVTRSLADSLEKEARAITESSIVICHMTGTIADKEVFKYFHCALLRDKMVIVVFNTGTSWEKTRVSWEKVAHGRHVIWIPFIDPELLGASLNKQLLGLKETLDNADLLQQLNH